MTESPSRSDQALALRRQGLVYHQIGEAMGISLGRARQLVLNAERKEARRGAWPSGKYWDVVAECLAKDWVVKLGLNPCSPAEACCVTLVNWRTGGFWTAFCPTWDAALGATLERVRQD